MWLGFDGTSIERIDLCARSVSQYIPTLEPNSDNSTPGSGKLKSDF